VIALSAILLIIAGCLYYTIRDIRRVEQSARIMRRFGGA
jgi:hypothetical protein